MFKVEIGTNGYISEAIMLRPSRDVRMESFSPPIYRIKRQEKQGLKTQPSFVLKAEVHKKGRLPK